MKNREVSYNDIYQSGFTSICRYCMNYAHCDMPAAEDIASDVFSELFNKWESFKTHTEAGIMAWLFRTAVFKTKEYQRKAAKLPVTETYDDEKEYPQNDVDEVREDDEAYSRCIKLIRETLSESDWETFEYKYVKQYDFNKIAGIYGIKKTALYVRCFRIRQRIRLALGDQETRICK